MTQFILVLSLITTYGVSTDSIKTPYTSEQSCKEAGDIWKSKMDSTFKDAYYVCLPNK